MKLSLPWPPSINSYWRNFQGRMIISAKGREYRKAVIDLISKEGLAVHIEKPMRVTIEAFRPDRRKRDLDNLLKSTIDALAHAGVFKDDSLIHDLRIYWGPEIAGMLKVDIEVIDERTH